MQYFPLIDGGNQELAQEQRVLLAFMLPAFDLRQPVGTDVLVQSRVLSARSTSGSIAAVPPHA